MQFDIITNVVVFKKWVMFLLTNINSLIKTIGILDVIDILVVAYFLFRIYLMLKNTRAAVLVKGLLTLGAIMFISRWLNLHVISWVLEKSMTVLIVALPIVFQPELRRALDQIGRSRLTRQVFSASKRQGSKQTEQHVAELVRAINNMARKKIGALIVFERSTGLGDVIDSGTMIDGEISDPLIENIFEPNTPLHDGAMIIRDERIVAAACILQLSDNYTISRELGTRHRAAIGITESTDAISLIVSEETGIVSMARDGKLTRYLDAKSLTILLTEIFTPERRHAMTLRELIDAGEKSRARRGKDGRNEG